jgi:hypothetical protein
MAYPRPAQAKRSPEAAAPHALTRGIDFLLIATRLSQLSFTSNLCLQSWSIKTMRLPGYFATVYCRSILRSQKAHGIRKRTMGCH